MVRTVATWSLAIVLAALLVVTGLAKIVLDLPSFHLIFRTAAEWMGLPEIARVAQYVFGFLELLAAVFLLVPSMQASGAMLALAIFVAAIFFHLVSPLGIDVGGTVTIDGRMVVVPNDGGLRFIASCVGAVVALGILVLSEFRDDV